MNKMLKGKKLTLDKSKLNCKLSTKQAISLSK